ncbi:MAG TPA: catalase [Steroidobacteraceae bacterium]|nr:catalase [Steroidobacteraceae bacterium]
MEQKPKLAIVNCCPVADNQNVLTAGSRGLVLPQDIGFVEKLARFDRDPERFFRATAIYRF